MSPAALHWSEHRLFALERSVPLLSALATVESPAVAPESPDVAPDLRGLVRDYARYTLFRHPIPGTPLPSLSFPLVTAGVVTAADIYCSSPGPGDRRAPRAESSPDPGAGFRLQRGDPTGDKAANLASWRKRLRNSVRPQLAYVSVEHWTVYECWQALPPLNKQCMFDVALHTSIEPERDEHGNEKRASPPNAKGVARRLGLSEQALRRHVTAGCEAMVRAIYERLTTPVHLRPVSDENDRI